MSDDLIDLPLGEDEGEPVFPTDEPATPPSPTRPTRTAQRRRTGSVSWRRVVPVALVLLISAWLFWRPPKLELLPFEPAPAVAPVGDASQPVEIMVRNPGRRRVVFDDIRLVGAEGFSIGLRDCGEELVAGATCRIQVLLVPAAMGEVTTTLEVVGSQRGGISGVSIRGEGLGARLLADPQSLDFGATPVDGQSSPRNVEIVNRGTLAGEVGRVSVDGRDFRVTANRCRGSLQPQESCVVEVAFTPRAMGDRKSALLAASEVAGPLPPVVLAGRGTGPGFEIRPARLAFNQTKVGSDSAAMEVTWLNQGDEAWRVGSPRLEGDGFRLVSDTCARRAVPPGGSCSAKVVFSPRESGSTTAELALVHRNGERFPPAELSGTGTAARLQFDLRSLRFTATPVGRSSPPRTVRLTNSGSAEAEISRIGVAGNGASSVQLDHDCQQQLAAGATCTLQARLTPGRSGQVEAELRVQSDDPDSPLTLAVSGDASSPELELSRQRLDFATVPQGEFQDLQLAVENPGSAALEIIAVTPTGSGFSLPGDECSGRMVVAGGDCSLLVRFQPAVPGAHVGEVEVRSAIGTARVTLSGLAGEPPIPRVEIAPTSIGFESTRVGGRSSVETVTVTSRGPGVLRLGQIRIEGEGAAAFRLVPGTCDDLDSLVAESRCSVGVRFQPGGEGQYVAAIVVRGSGDPAVLRASLIGTTAP